MPEEKKVKGEYVAGIAGLGLAGLGIYLLAKKAEAKPPEPPPPGLANLYGVVADAETGKVIANVLVNLNGYSTATNSSGYYQFTNLELGGYTAEFSKEGYTTEVR